MQVGRRRLLVLSGLLFASLFRLPAASVLDFPRLSNQSGSIVGVVIVNPGGVDAPVAITAYGMGGQTLSASQAVVPAGQRLGVLTSDLFPNLDPDVVGWFQAVSDVSGLTGFFLFLNSDPSQLDGADLPIRDRDIVFNKIQIDGDLSTELNIVNPGSTSIQLELTLIGAANPVAKALDLVARGAARLDVATFFGVNQVSPGAYVIVNAPADIVGFEFIRRQGADLQGLNARSAEEFLNTLYFAQMAVLGPFEAELGVVNYSRQSVIVVVTAHKPDGSLFIEATQQNPVTIALGPGGSDNRDLQSLFGFQGDAVLEGWLEVTANTEAINGQLTYRVVGSGAAAAVAVVPQGTKASIFAHVATTLGFFTGIAVLNSAALPATVEIAVLDSEGTFLGGFTTVLNPGTRISELITDLVPEAADLAGGFIWFRSNVPLFLSALFGSVQGDVLANVPAQQVSQNFDPVQGLLEIKINPPLAVLSPTNAQSFTVEGGSGAIDWAVNDIPGGSAQFGTISSTGVYTAPAIVVPDLPVTVSARSGNQSAAAGVDLISKQELVGDLGIVQSVAYLGGLDRLFSAELVALAEPAREERPAGFLDSAVFDITPPDTRFQLAGFDDTITNMISFLARDGREYLFFCGSDSGTVQRLDPVSGDTTVVASGLNSPQAIAFDSFSQNFLVAEADQISTIPRSEAEQGLSQGPAGKQDSASRIPASELIPNDGVGGIQVDRCNGNIYFSLPAEGLVLIFNRANVSISILASGLNLPGQLLLLYRRGLTCPDSSHLLVAEADRISLIVPASGEVITWVEFDSGTLIALVFIPAESSFADQDGLLVINLDEGGLTAEGVIFFLPDLYDDGPVNPPVTVTTTETETTDPGPDLAISAATGQQAGNATVNVFFRPGPASPGPGGSDKIAAAVFSIDYDETKLSFNPADSNGDGIPDAIIPSLPGAFEMTVLFDSGDGAGRLDFVLVDLNGALAILPEGNLFSITFVSISDIQETATVAFATTPEVSIADNQGLGHQLDQISSGKVTVFPLPGLTGLGAANRR